MENTKTREKDGLLMGRIGRGRPRKGNFRIANVNEDFLNYLKTNPSYKELSTNDATKKLHDDITTGKFTNDEMKQRLNKIIEPLEEMFYGKKKKPLF